MTAAPTAAPLTPRFDAKPSKGDRFDVVVIGSGFGSLFFVEGFLQKRPKARVVILERGRYNSDAWQVRNQKNSDVAWSETYRAPQGHKPWNFTIGVGGGTSCWWGQTPRFHPNDFRTRTLYGVGQDWPLSYADLEPYYVTAERKMSVSGAPEMAQILPRSAPFPLPPHRPSAVDKVMRKAQPDFHFPIATARASVSTPERSRCCASANCGLCPVNAKFTFDNGFKNLTGHPSVTFLPECEVTRLDVANGTARAAVYRHDGREEQISGDLFVLGANGIHSPAILLRSGVPHPLTGVGINEQVGYSVEVMLAGLDGLDGSTVTTGLNYRLYDGDHRKRHGGALIFFDNHFPYGLRKEFGRWRQIAPLTVVVEDLPKDANRVEIDADGMPRVLHASVSDYATRGVERSLEGLQKVLAPLPVERIDFKRMRPTEAHIQGSLRMGLDRSSSVVDARQVHHMVRNLVVVGSSVFPSCPPANPSLSVAALSLRSAALLAS
jgi:choline dehydrogenase-like flavoprotein